jgi:hypothetical protein
MRNEASLDSAYDATNHSTKQSRRLQNCATLSQLVHVSMIVLAANLRVSRESTLNQVLDSLISIANLQFSLSIQCMLRMGPHSS